MRDRLAVYLFAINREDAGAAFGWAGAVVFEIENDGVLARASERPGPLEALHIQQVVKEYWLASAYSELAPVKTPQSPRAREYQQRMSKSSTIYFLLLSHVRSNPKTNSPNRCF